MPYIDVGKENSADNSGHLATTMYVRLCII